jgi:poly(3-hydroxybutyrate) depolymerase
MPEPGTGGMPEPNTGGVDGVAGAPVDGGMSGAGGGGGFDITDVVKTAGCGKAFSGQSGAKVTIQTSGVKDADCADKLNGVPKCGPWSTPRDYYVYLPQNYDPTHAYTLIFQGPGCGGNGTNVYSLDNNVNNTAIRVGLTPGPNSLGHATNENQGCFDDREGDDSIDFVFYELLFDKLSTEICFDKNRVFASGNSTGGYLANELGCKYAGDPLRPIRGVLVNTGGLPTEPQWTPTCTNAPMAGMWVHEIGDTTQPFNGNKVAIDRAMKVNGCTIGTSYDTAQFDNYPIGGGNLDSTCKKLKGCPALYPLVVCALPGNQHGSHDSIVNPSFATFVTGLQP